MTIATETVAYRDADRDLTGVLYWDGASRERRPGVLVVHGGAGLGEHAKGRAQRIAELGYVALACDMFGAGVAGDRQRILACIAELRAEVGTLCRRAQAGMEVLLAHPLFDGRSAAVGYCFGGMTVLELARSGVSLAGVVSVHGTLQGSKPAEEGVMTARVLVCHGALDPYVNAVQVTAFMGEMENAKADWQLNVYGGAYHGFTHEAVSNMPGVAYHAHADRRSSKAIEAFLTELFKAGHGAVS